MNHDHGVFEGYPGPNLQMNIRICAKILKCIKISPKTMEHRLKSKPHTLLCTLQVVDVTNNWYDQFVLFVSHKLRYVLTNYWLKRSLGYTNSLQLERFIEVGLWNPLSETRYGNTTK